MISLASYLLCNLSIQINNSISEFDLHDLILHKAAPPTPAPPPSLTLNAFSAAQILISCLLSSLPAQSCPFKYLDLNKQLPSLMPAVNKINILSQSSLTVNCPVTAVVWCQPEPVITVRHHGAGGAESSPSHTQTLHTPHTTTPLTTPHHTTYHTTPLTTHHTTPHTTPHQYIFCKEIDGFVCAEIGTCRLLIFEIIFFF